ncbi:crustacyanin-A2 subunit [Hyalella azteca]|uniref:Crustacyanin-A2 subunit n=1 Tax=Hyalella azteca TaxID=294128 RepID=A0A8B7NCY3_HYAAZ|nr:crustacyanin-A2 subunit [Hyalella azteca]
MYLFITLVLLAVILPCQAFLSPPSFLRFGSCSEVPVQGGLNLQKFAGLWYTVEKMPNEYDPAKFCINTQYSYHGDHMESVQRGLYEDRSKQKLMTFLVVPNVTDPVMTVIADGMPNAPLKIIATDYDNYACMYTCLGFVGLKAEFGMVLTRQALPPPSAVQVCRDLFENSTDMNISTMEIIEQGKNCPYWSKLDKQDRDLYESYLTSRSLVSEKTDQDRETAAGALHDTLSNSAARAKLLDLSLALTASLVFLLRHFS